MPEPMTVPITIAVAITGPSARSNLTLEEEDVVLMIDQSNRPSAQRKSPATRKTCRSG